MRKHVTLQRLKLFPGLHPELAVKDRAGTAVHIERVRLTSRAVQGEHEPSVERLAQRHLANEPTQLGHEFEMAAAGEIRVDPPFQCKRPQFVEPSALGSRGIAGSEIAEGRTAPEGERGSEASRRRLGIAGGECARCLGDEDLEPRKVDVAPVRPQPIAVGLRLDPGGPNRPAKTGDVDAERVVRTGRWILAPNLFDEPICRDRLADVQDEEGEDRALSAAADLDWAAGSDDLERTEHAELHRRHGWAPGATAGRGQPCVSLDRRLHRA